MDEDIADHPRTKRQKIDKTGRFAALKKLKELKGQKHKYELEEKVDSVYDVVDEKEYEKRAREVYSKDWIEDDGTGYLEDGRDFFEDEDDYGEVGSSSKSKKRQRDEDKKSSTRKGSIRNMFSNVTATKKKETKVKLDEDEILSDILGEIEPKNEVSSSVNGKRDVIINSNQNFIPRKAKSDEVVAKEYMQNFLSSLKKKDIKQTKNDDDDDKIIADALNSSSTKTNSKSNNLSQKTEVVKEKHVEVKEKNEKPSAKHDVEDIGDFEELSEAVFESCLKETQKEIRISESLNKVKLDEKKSEVEEKELPPSINEHFTSEWDNIFKSEVFKEDFTTETTTAVDDALEEKSLSNENLKIWYWDAWEDTLKHNGQVFLFGRIQSGKEFKSVSVQIENVDKVLYLLPREYMLDPITKEKTKQPVTFKDMYNEFNDKIAKELGIVTFSSQKVTKNFAFHLPGVDVPESCEYLEIRYEGKKPTPDTKKKYDTIAHIFGTTTPALETFLLECKVKGPCWLNLKNFRMRERALSWCKIEIICSSLNSIKVAEEQSNSPPPLVFIGLNVKTALNPKTLKNEIVMISCLVNNRFHIDKPPSNPPFNRHFCGFTRPSTQIWPLDLAEKLSNFKSTKITKFDSERTLLSWFLATYQTIDPDLIVTHDASDCQLDAIADRIALLKIPMWSRLGRLRISQITSKKFKDFFIGRMICDVKQSAEELIKSRSYDLDTLCTNVLKLEEGKRVDVSNDDLYTMYESGEGLLKLITLTMQDCLYIIRLMCELNVLPLALQITNICGNLMSRTLQGGRSERNEYLLLHAFNEKNYIVPDKKKREVNWDAIATTDTQAQQPGTTRKKAAYSGGLVLEPQKGFYDKFILLMDFNSLYPSIIQEYNICFTTVTEPDEPDGIPSVPNSNTEHGVLPRQIRRLVESRREVKKLMANPDLAPEQKMQYNIRQLALKLTANSMYGCLGFSHSRFFAQHLAALVTHKGREILMDTKSLVQKLNFNVIYGDTDSIMINTNCTDYDQVFKIGQNIKQTVNKVYRQIELDIDGVFKYLLLLKKKKYAAVLITKTKTGEFVYTQEHKGLDIVRRDWSQISVMIGKIILDEILSDNQLDEKIENIHNHLEKCRENIINGLVPLQLLTITKQLTKEPKDYLAIHQLPHVQVALRMNTERNKRYKKGDMISYIICDDGTENVPMQRAYHLDEIKSNPKLKVDVNYYLAQQIHPVVSRLCEPLEGTDAGRIASCLGLDPSKFKSNAQKVHKERMDDGEGIQIIKSALQKYRQCEKFKFICVACKTENIVAAAFKPNEKTYISVLEKCSNNECKTSPYQYVVSIRNQLLLQIRQCIRRFYENWMVCDDPACNKNTRVYSHLSINNRPLCLSCRHGTLIRQYSERDLFNQLCYFQYMFDLNHHEKKSVNLSPEIQFAYNLLKETIDQILQNSAYCTISLSQLFAFNNVALKTNQICNEPFKDI